MPPFLSFIIPAYNEEALIGRTLERLEGAATAAEAPFEVLVVNDASTDRTAEVAQAHGARVLTVDARQIAAARNAGARAARGDVLVFIDADTLVPEAVLRAMLRELAAGAAAGGARLRFDGEVGLLTRCLTAVFFFVYFRVARWAAGCFVYARRDAFEAAGGFDERYFASEEVHLSRVLKKLGRFVVVKEKVVTSARKLRMHGLGGNIAALLRLGMKGPRALRTRDGLELWYDGRRE